MANQKFRENVDGNKLDLSMYELTEVPVKDIAMIKKAVVLDLSNNQLISIPVSFGSLTHLVELDLSKNMIRELPESFGKLKNLRLLDLYGNQLSHLPLSFCHLKSLRWLDLKNNPLVPMLEDIAGPCGDERQCMQCARDIVDAFTKAAIQVEEDRNRLLQKKLREQEKIEQKYLAEKRELEGEGSKKGKKKNRKNKAEKQSDDNSEKEKIAAPENDSPANNVGKPAQDFELYLRNSSGRQSALNRCLGFILLLALVVVSTSTVLLLCSILLAANDRNDFLKTVEGLPLIPKSVTSFILYLAEGVEYASKHPAVREIISLLAACVETLPVLKHSEKKGYSSNCTSPLCPFSRTPTTKQLAPLHKCHRDPTSLIQPAAYRSLADGSVNLIEMDKKIPRDHLEQEIVTHNLQVKALIQDISHVRGPMELLNDMNAEGREKLALLKKHIEQLEIMARECDTADRQYMLTEAKSYRQQFTSSLAAFRQANISAMLRIEKSEKDELFNHSNRTEDAGDVGVRQRKDKVGLAKMSSNVTDQLLSISRNLADTTQRSAETLETLANSSTSVHSTRDELLTTSSVIQQSGTLLAKYGRRELTDKVLLFFAFAFFFACVLYIVHKRLF